MPSVPDHSFDWTKPFFSLHEAARCFVMRGMDGRLTAEFDYTTIDPMFLLIQSGHLEARGIKRGTGELQPIVGVWQTATCGDCALPMPNWVGLWPADRHSVGSTIRVHGDPASAAPMWTHVELASAGLRELFGISGEPKLPPTDPYGVGDFVPTGRSGRPDTKPAILKVARARRAKGEASDHRKTEAKAIQAIMDALTMRHGWPETAYRHIYSTLGALKVDKSGNK